MLEVTMDEGGRDLTLDDGATESVWGWDRVLKEGRDAVVAVEGVDSLKGVGIIGQYTSAEPVSC